MASRKRRSERRTDALSRERIVEAAIELLDTVGEGELTFRALTERLATGPGAIYWHVANKNELLDAATDAVIAVALTLEPTEPPASPQDEIRAVALALFAAIGEHPWLATQLSTQLSRSLWGSVTPRIVERIGHQVRALGVPESHQFNATFALMHYILGAAAQNAVNTASARTFGAGMNRGEFLDAAAAVWEALDPDDYPFTRSIADQLRDHDDRDQFLSGVEFILDGITAVHPPATTGPSRARHTVKRAASTPAGKGAGSVRRREADRS